MSVKQEDTCPVAIVGMSCFFPKSPGLKAYWRLLFHGRDAVTEVPGTHWSKQDYFDPDPRTPDHVYCARGGFISPVDFDPSEFGIPPASLEATDTSQLLALVAAKQAVSDAGLPLDRDRTSVILGVTGTQELVIPLSSRLGFPHWRRALEAEGLGAERSDRIIRRISEAYVPWQENSFPGLLGNVVAGRISNRLNLGGTNCVVDAACASSLAAVHLALLELASGRCDTVISGGVDTLNDIFMHMCFAKTQVLSPTGDARPFSSSADGTVLGEGIGLLVLKRLADAERDGSRIYAVIRGIGSSSDGRSQSIYAPRREGQVKALQAAYSAAGVDPATVELIEAHGTGTRVGDRVEFEALCQVMGGRGADGKRCALGSVKSMIGHTKAAAGAAGLVKTALALYHKVLPPTLKADEPDPALSLEASAFYLNTRTRPWPAPEGHPRRAGVSAFGFGGSNFHLVLEEHRPEKPGNAWDGSVEILAFSADSRPELAQAVDAFARQAVSASNAAAFGRAAAQTRAGYDARRTCRCLLVIEDPSQASAALAKALGALRSAAADSVIRQPDFFLGEAGECGRLAFLFPGQGSQYAGMGRDTVCTFASAMAVLENAGRRWKRAPRLGDLIYPRPGAEPKDPEAALRATDAAQPAIGAVSLAMLRVLEEFGLLPDAAAGHSFGELTALCAAGRIEEAAYFDLAASRGEAMAQAEPGSMLAVRAPVAELEALIARSGLPIVLANRNSPEQAVLSGRREAIDEAARVCRGSGYAVRALPVGGAFHSPLMRGAQEAFLKDLNAVPIAPGRVPVFSNTTSGPYPADPQEARRLLAEHLLRPVDFAAEIESMHRWGVRTFVEVGPKSVLTGLVAATLRGRPFQALALDPSGGRDSGMADLARALCHLAALGYPVRLERWESPEPAAAEPRMRVTIAGTNYRSFRPEVRQPPPEDGPAPLATTTLVTPVEDAMAKNPSTVSDALRSVQEALKTIQSIQIQTAQAHQKFLETQNEASRILLDLVKGTGRLAEAPAAAVGGLPTEGSAPPAGVPMRLEPPAAALPPAEAAETEAPAGPGAVETRATPAAAEAARSGRLEATLLAVVSELTGYPVEMLGLDMDIEADLGIDSIKRVEILSTLEEKIPGLPAVAPEDMGRLKTLGQIIGFLTDSPSLDPRPPLPEASRPASAGADAGQAGAIGSALLAVVSELTGYPVEMLGLDMDIEADLGIDSIKRVEILSTLEEKIPGLPAVAPEDMGRLKTLGQIIAHLDRSRMPAPAPAPLEPEDAAGPRTSAPARRPEAVAAETADAGLAERRVVAVTEVPPAADAAFSLPKGRKVFVTDDRSGLSQAITAELGEMGLNTVLVSVDILRFKRDLPHAAGLVIVQNPGSPDPEADLANAFDLTRAFGADLQEAAGRQGAFFATVTRLDGAFGFSGRPLSNPLQGALAGLAKTAAAEWPDVHCRALDIDPSWRDTRAIANAVVREFMARGPVEIGLGEGCRRALSLTPAPYPEGRVDLGPADVVVVSGGARGITAACALELARRFKPTLILLGRSPEPVPEPDWLHGLEGEADVKKAILENEFGGGAAKPAAVEARFRQLAANREIARTLEQIAAAGAAVRYHSVDIRDADRVAAIVADVRAQHGPVRAVIHAAGVLEDRLIVDKSPEQFRRVFDTKVKGLHSLLAAASDDDLRYIVIYSSVTARIGNRGQVDYAMANEALNKAAVAESRRRPACRVVSINWGPWEGGMVTPPLKREFERQGVALLPVASGVRSLIQEMGGEADGPVEVVIGGTLRPTRAEKAPETSAQQLCILFEREIDLGSHPILKSHMIDGKAVVPLALMAEWFGHGALHENPGLMLHGLEDVRVLNGIRLGEESKLIRLLAGKARRRDGYYEVDLELRNGVREGKDILHSRARAILAEEFGPPPKYSLPEALSCNHYPRSVAEVYERILFHGSHLHGLRAVQCCTADGMVAEVSGAPAPDQWISSPLRNSWLCDPLVLDSAFQMASLWCYDQRGCVSLPSHAASYRQFRHAFPAEGAKVVLEVRAAGERKMRGDFTFLDADGEVIARLNGYEAVMDPLLNRAFKPEMKP